MYIIEWGGGKTGELGCFKHMFVVVCFVVDVCLGVHVKTGQ